MQNSAINTDEIVNESAISHKKFNLKEKVESIMLLAQEVALQKQLKLELEYDPSIPTYVIGDAPRVHRILLELVNNALQFTERGYIRVTAAIVERKKQHLGLMLVVIDTGKGMFQDKKGEIDLASYGEININQKNGRGLAIVKKYIDDLHAEIYVQSELGQGTNFTCFIPLYDAALINVEDIPSIFEDVFAMDGEEEEEAN